MATQTIAVSPQSTMTFEGSEIASVSTQHGEQPRWTEMVLYKRDDGGYVLLRYGKSIMYHLPSCRQMRGRVDLTFVDEPDEEAWPCEECKPEESTEPVFVEPDKIRATTVMNADKLVAAMWERNKREPFEMRFSPLSQRLLKIAGEAYDDIADAAARRVMEQSQH